jgi:hypothetical protein
MGGDLVVLAQFPDGVVRIKNFGDLELQARVLHDAWGALSNELGTPEISDAEVSDIQDVVKDAVQVAVSRLSPAQKSKLKKQAFQESVAHSAP